MAEAKAGKVMVADRLYADGGGGKLMVAEADQPYADGGGQGGKLMVAKSESVC